MATHFSPPLALRPELAAIFRCLNGKGGKPARQPQPLAGILAELAAQGRPQ